MSVDVIGQFARKIDAVAWLESKWREYGDLRVDAQHRFDGTKQDRVRLRNFEKRCAEALERRENNQLTTQFNQMSNAEVRHVVRLVVGKKPAGAQYKDACIQYNRDHAEAWNAVRTAKHFHATLLRHTARFYQKFGREQEPSLLADYIDEQRGDDRWGFLDAFFEERPDGWTQRLHLSSLRAHHGDQLRRCSVPQRRL